VEQEKKEFEINSRSKEFSDNLQKLFELEPDNQKFVSELLEVKNLEAIYHQTRDEQIELILNGKNDEARQLMISLQDERFEKIRSIAMTISNDAFNRYRLSIEKSEQSTNKLIIIFLIIGIIVIFLSLMIVMLLNRIIAKPLNEIAVTAKQISLGDLSVKILVKNQRDEVGILTTSFNDMLQSLQAMAFVANRISEGDLSVEIKPKSDKDTLGIAFSNMIKNLSNVTEVANKISEGDLTVKIRPKSDKDILGYAFSNMINNLSNMTREIRKGVEILATSASEIFATTTQVATGASETATAVSETTTTVEEVKQTTLVSNQKAKYVLESTEKANQAAQIGSKSVEESIGIMTTIKEQMESIAERTVKLHEQSQAIGEIIETVNEIAEQSNLLAVNAAIEAAKAGEQGRGFSVVAQEVRNLAEQSKQSTAQVRTILNDIQKAISSAVAVIATEQGNKAVILGVQQSVKARDALRIMIDNVIESSQASTQIAASSQQQLIGMDQVALAMENIKQATYQNTESTKQTEFAAKNLHELGQNLKHLVEKYKL
jgi:methyl-accepting chemotaxis protein